MKPKSAAVKVYALSSPVVTVLSSAVGAVLAAAPLTLWPVLLAHLIVGQHGVEPAHRALDRAPLELDRAALVPDPDAVVVDVAFHHRVAEHERRRARAARQRGAPQSQRGRARPSQDTVADEPRQNSNSGAPTTVTDWSKVTVNRIISPVP